MIHTLLSWVNVIFLIGHFYFLRRTCLLSIESKTKLKILQYLHDSNEVAQLMKWHRRVSGGFLAVVSFYFFFSFFSSMSADLYYSSILLTVSNIMSGFLCRNVFFKIKYGLDEWIYMEKSVAKNEVTEWSRPAWKYWEKILTWKKHFVDVSTGGVDNIPSSKQRVFFITNHWNPFIDMGIFTEILMKERNSWPRCLLSEKRFQIPVMSDFCKYFGGAQASTAMCDILMKNNQPIVLYGAGKSEDGEYEWNDRIQFIEKAIDMNYSIIPVICCEKSELIDEYFGYTSEQEMDFKAKISKRLFGGRKSICVQFGDCIDCTDFSLEEIGEVEDNVNDSLASCIDTLYENAKIQGDMDILNQLKAIMKMKEKRK